MKKIIKKWAAPLLCGLFTFLLFKFVLFVGYVPSKSMEPSIEAGSFIFGCRIVSDIHSGEIIAFKRDSSVLIKRVTAVAGDTIYIDNDSAVLIVNEELPNASRVLRVPENCYFVIGDNLEYSLDSRVWEDPFITKSNVIAKIWK